ncbi:hypothetical protein JOY44_03955 [Phormidium sp. CLA17]|uniref:hypothetical protein n=1 Tax=Leptolyngbya sp. Cla-17 TaxID=2803751 RepID=UPI001492E535|nr:hypothetical protein [Leptolyngbya sp. Cla-17]MBM0740778.1 hypothetical protein [Leptolyngbya sp. Cla-17]
MIAFSRTLLVPALLSLSLVAVACGDKPPSSYDQVQKETQGQSAVSKQAVNGTQLNKYFPRSADGFSVVAAQEKKGFAEHKVNKGGKNVAMLSISDTVSTPESTSKYKQSTSQIAGFPSVDQGQNGTGVLVSDRFQVKAQSRDPSFTKQDRVNWIQKFNLNGLSKQK